MTAIRKEQTVHPISTIVDLFLPLAVNLHCYLRHPYLVALAMRGRTGLPNPARPIHVHDKFLWRKIFDRDPHTVAMSDKLAAKDMAKALCPGIRVPRTLRTGERFEDIPADMLTGNVVIKANDGSGFFHVIRNAQYDRTSLIRLTRKWMERDYSRHAGEWNYRDIQRKLFVEELLMDKNGRPASSEAKVYAFGGTPLCSFHFHDRLAGDARQSLYDAAGNSYDFDQYRDYPVSFDPPPAAHARLFDVATKLAAGRDHVRIDLYDVDGEIYFSEFTFYNMGGRFGSGIRKHFPQMSELWDLRHAWFLRERQPCWRGTYVHWLRQKLDAGDDGARKSG
jgi:hypothetical protein